MQKVLHHHVSCHSWAAVGSSSSCIHRGLHHHVSWAAVGSSSSLWAAIGSSSSCIVGCSRFFIIMYRGLQ